MSFLELALSFTCEQEQLMGVVCHPPIKAAANRTGVVIVVGGPQYRIGSHRQFVRLARSLAAQGYAVMRFDVRGTGDSTGTPLGFESLSADIGVAINTFQTAVPSVERIVLWGLCDGASAGLLYVLEASDTRIAGLCLLNPWVRSDAGLARTHVRNYYHKRLLQVEFWQKLLLGGVGFRAVSGLFKNILRMVQPAVSLANGNIPFQQRMRLGWAGFDGSILLILSGDDLTAQEFIGYSRSDPSWVGLLKKDNVTRQDIADADHTFSLPGNSERVELLTLQWLQKLAP